MKLRTWHYEALLVATILATISVIKGRAIEWLGSLAVLFSFMHAQISFRMSEAEAKRSETWVECFRKAQYYFLLKESCWFLYFLYLGSWSALAGVIIFLIYPLWRQYHLERRAFKDHPNRNQIAETLKQQRLIKYTYYLWTSESIILTHCNTRLEAKFWYRRILKNNPLLNNNLFISEV